MPSAMASVWVMLLTFAAVVMACSKGPLPSQIRGCLLPVLCRSTGDGPVTPPVSRGRRNVHAHPRPVEFPARFQLREQNAVQPIQGPGLLPTVHAPPARLSGAERQPRRQVLPCDVLLQDVEDALQA